MAKRAISGDDREVHREENGDRFQCVYSTLGSDVGERGHIVDGMYFATWGAR